MSSTTRLCHSLDVEHRASSTPCTTAHLESLVNFSVESGPRDAGHALSLHWASEAARRLRARPTLHPPSLMTSAYSHHRQSDLGKVRRRARPSTNVHTCHSRRHRRVRRSAWALLSRRPAAASNASWRQASADWSRTRARRRNCACVERNSSEGLSKDGRLGSNVHIVCLTGAIFIQVRIEQL